jgi:hypothetical protein
MRYTYYVETFRHNGKVGFNVRRAADFSVDTMSPQMTAVFRVTHVKNGKDAVSCILEYAAGFQPCVQLVYGGKVAESVA